MLTSFCSDVHGILMSPTALYKFRKKVRTSFRTGEPFCSKCHTYRCSCFVATLRDIILALSCRGLASCYIVISISLEKLFRRLNKSISDPGIVKILVAPRNTPNCHSDRWKARRHWNAMAMCSSVRDCPIDKHSRNWKSRISYEDVCYFDVG